MKSQGVSPSKALSEPMVTSAHSILEFFQNPFKSLACMAIQYFFKKCVCDIHAGAEARYTQRGGPVVGMKQQEILTANLHVK